MNYYIDKHSEAIERNNKKYNHNAHAVDIFPVNPEDGGVYEYEGKTYIFSDNNWYQATDSGLTLV